MSFLVGENARPRDHGDRHHRRRDRPPRLLHPSTPPAPARTIDRIVDCLRSRSPASRSVSLSMNLKAVISQLLPPAPRRHRPHRRLRVMILTSSIGALLRDNKSYRIHNEILTGGKYGMVALEASSLTFSVVA